MPFNHLFSRKRWYEYTTQKSVMNVPSYYENEAITRILNTEIHLCIDNQQKWRVKWWSSDYKKEKLFSVYDRKIIYE